MGTKQKQRKRERIRISNNALFALAILLIIVNSYTFLIASEDILTGKQTATGTTEICIGQKIGMQNPTPSNYIVINETYNSTLKANGTYYIEFNHLKLGGVRINFGTDHDADDDGIYNATLNASALPDGNCDYRIIARGYGACGITDTKSSVMFTINNIDTPPKWNKFKNPLSTNFSQYTSWVNIPGAKIGIPGAGMIEFSADNFDDADLDYMFNISYNFITMNISSDNYNCYVSRSHKLTFFNITEFAEPVVLKNGELCGFYCTNLQYNQGNYSFETTATGESNFTLAEGGLIKINLSFNNKTFDNSPSINFTTYMQGSVRNLSYPANCTYKTDYNPVNFTWMKNTNGTNHTQTLPEQNWSYKPTGMGHYQYIQHHDFYSGLHVLTLNCTVPDPSIVYNDPSIVVNNTFLIRYTDRDKVFYEDGDEVKLYLELEEPNLTIDVNLSQIDSNFNPSNVAVFNNATHYNISYNISAGNTVPDGQYNITIEAFNSTGHETMNGSIFIHLHNTWARPDIDDAFDCWNFKPGYYFDEAACNWESDVNRVAKRLVDVLFTEISCFDGIDNDGDGYTDEDDTDCAGIYYSIRRFQGIDSAFLDDPCHNNVCRMCLGTDNNGNGICDTSDGVNVQYLHHVRPGAQIKARYIRSNIPGQSVRVSVNFLPASFGISEATSYIQQLPRIELGGCTGGTDCRSVTATTFGAGLPDTWTGALDEKIRTNISGSTPEGDYPSLAAGRSIGGSSAFQNMIFFEVRDWAIIDEGDNATYCFDNEDNDLSGVRNCFDPSCNLTRNPANLTERCEYPHEITCDDGYDNDQDGFTDCEDDDCFQKNGTNGPCYAIEDFNSTSCADSINNDYDWGYRCDPATSVSYQTRQTNASYSGAISIPDCLDIDCDGDIGDTGLGAQCEYCNEVTCNDLFDNDADHYYDCTGNAWRSQYDRDCDRWNDPLITCPTVENNCSDNLDNDLDSDSLNGEFSWLGIPVYGGWDCQDLDCDDEIGDETTGARCQYGNETVCDDGFDNDGDGLVDCEDPTTCKGLSGADQGLQGLCRPCAAIENISVDACRDTDDNDYDGLVDCADPNCTGMWKQGTGLCNYTETNCTDGIDNDYDWLIDENDPDCVIVTYTVDELGPGQCDDGLDNDGDGGADCSDPDCQFTLRCQVGSYDKSYCENVNVGAITVCPTRFVVAGENYTVKLSRNSLNAGSLLFIIGNSQYSLRNITSEFNTTTTFMTGTTTDFALLRGSDGLAAENNAGFNGDLDLNMISTTDHNLTPGYHDIYILTSVEGSIDDATSQVYIAENEDPPLVTNITAEAGHRTVTPGTVNVTFTVNASDQGTYNSGIAFCQMELPGEFKVNSTTCTHTTNLGSGTYNVTAIAYDGALNPSARLEKEISISIWTRPWQKGSFYNPYPAENYPDKNFFNDTEKLNIGINFDDGSGYADNATGCVVRIKNSTDVVLTDHVNLSAVGDEAHCNGQIDLSPLLNLTNMTNMSWFPSSVYYFDVEVNDDASRSGTSAMQDFHFCYYYYDNSSGKYRCRDRCEEREIANTPPVLISPIPNQTWPRGTKLSVIDLDDYFIDPDNDPLTYSWDIDTTRINVSIDRANIVTFDPDISFYGFAQITFYANDGYDSTPSNPVTLEVVFRPLPRPTPIPSGGGGGGGADVNKTEIEVCEEDWICTEWGPCLPSGYQFRNCRDRNECGTTNNMPNTSRECIYIPTCRDKIRNQGETGVDCGGPCPPCPSCKDGILNQQEQEVLQIMSSDPEDRSDCGGPFCPACPTCEDNIWNGGEEGIDCGGPCRPCATCSDGIRNQGEVNIDCGGPCPSCGVKVQEIAFNWNLMLLIFSSIFLMIVLLIALLFGVFKKKFIRQKAKLLNYYMRMVRMFEKKKMVEKDLPIMQWVKSHIDRIEEDIPSKSVEHSVNEIDRLVRIFFKRIFLIRYAFTNDELMKELDKHKMPTVIKKASELLFEELAQIKYGGEHVDKEDLQTLARQVKVITERLVNEIETKKKTKISISERDIDKISKTLAGARKLGVKEIMKGQKKK